MKVVNGDLLSLAEDGNFDVIIHGCNGFCTMGSGIAKQIKKRYPKAYKADLKTKKGDSSKLGYFSKAYVSEGAEFYIINAYTQFKFGTDRIHVDYKAVQSVFQKIRTEFKGMRIGFPKIGAGLAGGDWTLIESLIKNELKGEDYTLVVFE